MSRDMSILKRIRRMIWGLAALGLATLSASCEKEILAEGGSEGQGTLAVVTRAGGDGSVISTPITLYVMNDGGSCVQKVTADTPDDGIRLDLDAASYRVYAIAGASSDDYSLPSKTAAAADAAVSLKSGKRHGDLMTASADVTVKGGQTSSVTLDFARKTIFLQSARVSQVPASVTAVTLEISPLYKTLLLNGDYGTDVTSYQTALTRQADGSTWADETGGGISAGHLG